MVKIDAICINQYDPDEKSVQVQRMQDIYRNAKQVLVWIGKEKDHTGLAFEQIQRLLACHDPDAEKEIWNEPGEWIACLNEMIKRPVRRAKLFYQPMLMTLNSTGLVHGRYKKSSLLGMRSCAAALTLFPSSTLHTSWSDKQPDTGSKSTMPRRVTSSKYSRCETRRIKTHQ